MDSTFSSSSFLCRSSPPPPALIDFIRDGAASWPISNCKTAPLKTFCIYATGRENNSPMLLYLEEYNRQLRARRALTLFIDAPLRTRRALSLSNVDSDLHHWSALTPFWLSSNNIRKRERGGGRELVRRWKLILLFNHHRGKSAGWFCSSSWSLYWSN